MSDGGGVLRGRLGVVGGVAIAGASLAALTWALIAFQSRELVDSAQGRLADQLLADAAFAASLVARADVASLPPIEGRRLTVIGADGAVLYDSVEDRRDMDNHGARPEVVAARRDGRGVSRRRSETLGRTMLYAARALPDGRVVRVAAPLPDGGEGAMAPPVAVLVSSAGAIGLCALFVLWHALVGRARAAELRAVAADFVAGRFARRANLTSADALGRVGRELNALGERLQATRADLDRQRSLLDGALGALSEGVACVDRLDRVVYANPAYARLAAAGGAALGQLWYEHLPSARLEPLLAGAATGATPGAAVEFAHHGRVLAASAAPGGPDARVVVLRDLTELKRLEGARRDFMAAVSHEFKTPLTSIAGFAETLLDGALAEDPPMARQFVEKIAGHADRLTMLVRDVLALSRLEQGAWEMRVERIDVARIAQAVLDDVQPAAAERDVRLRLDAPPTVPAAADAEVVRMIIGNLVSNAVRYNRASGSVTVSIARRDPATLTLVVEDTGIGIPAEHQERVFDRFYRVDAHRSRQTGGTGLGLAIVKQFVDLLGGSIALASGPDGTRFAITLPLAATVATVAPAATTADAR